MDVYMPPTPAAMRSVGSQYQQLQHYASHHSFTRDVGQQSSNLASYSSEHNGSGSSYTSSSISQNTRYGGAVSAIRAASWHAAPVNSQITHEGQIHQSQPLPEQQPQRHWAGSSSVFESLDTGSRRSFRDQEQPGLALAHLHQEPAQQQRVRSATPHTPPMAINSNGSRLRHSSSSNSGASGPLHSSSGSPIRLLHRQGSGFLAATANQLLSTLGALSGINLLGSSPRSSSSSSSSRDSTVIRAASTSSPHVAGLRSSLLVRGAAFLELDVSDSYDDLLALDQFNVKRAVRPLVLASLPCRQPCLADVQQQQQCRICFDMWAPAAPVEQAIAVEFGGETGATAAVVTTECATCLHHQDLACLDTSGVIGSDQSVTKCSKGRWAAGEQKAQPPAAGESIMQLPCGHEYCSMCITPWLQEHATCPVCRWTFPDDQTLLINLHK